MDTYMWSKTILNIIYNYTKLNPKTKVMNTPARETRDWNTRV